MKLARMVITMMAVALLFGGFLASLSASIQGTAAEYAQKIDVPPVRMLATIIFLGALVLAFLPDKEGMEQPEDSAE
ncbi:hypothetical protein MCEMSE15_00258 [Fimbriimonadaceae bacterium]